MKKECGVWNKLPLQSVEECYIQVYTSVWHCSEWGTVKTCVYNVHPNSGGGACIHTQLFI